MFNIYSGAFSIVYSINFSLHLWIGLLDSGLGLPKYLWSLPSESCHDQRCDSGFVSPVFAQGFFAVLGHLLNRLHSTVSHVTVSELDCSHNRVRRLACLGTEVVWGEAFAQDPLTMLEVRIVQYVDVYNLSS